MATRTMLLACMLVVGCAVILPTGARKPDTCMVQWFLRAGIGHDKALAIHKRSVLIGATESMVLNTPTAFLTFLFHTSFANVARIKTCIAGKSKRCRNYKPCYYDGQCQLTSSRKSYVCKCLKDFTGIYCQTPHPAPIGEFRRLQKIVAALRKSNGRMGRKLSRLGKKQTGFERKQMGLEKKQTGFEKKQVAQEKMVQRLARCNPTRLGYKYSSNWNLGDSRSSGALYTMSFRKMQTTTYLRLVFSSSLRNYGGAVRWFFQIDGRDCAKPSKIDYTRYRPAKHADNHTPLVISGVCQATSAGRIGKGVHTVTLNIGNSAGGFKIVNPYAGWVSTKFLEVREICPTSQ